MIRPENNAKEELVKNAVDLRGGHNVVVIYDGAEALT